MVLIFCSHLPFNRLLPFVCWYGAWKRSPPFLPLVVTIAFFTPFTLHLAIVSLIVLILLPFSIYPSEFPSTLLLSFPLRVVTILSKVTAVELLAAAPFSLSPEFRHAYVQTCGRNFAFFPFFALRMYSSVHFQFPFLGASYPNLRYFSPLFPQTGLDV